MNHKRPIHTTIYTADHNYITKIMDEQDMKMNDVIHYLVEHHRTWKDTTGEKILNHITKEILREYMEYHISTLPE